MNMNDLKRMFKSNRGVRAFEMLTIVVTLLFSVSCSSNDNEDEDKPSLQISKEFDDLKLLVEECKTASQDASFFSEASFAVYSQALEAAKKALETGVKVNGDYTTLLNNLKNARSALTLLEWKLITDYLPQCSMLIVMDEDDMPHKVNDEDKIGAFLGDKCLGIAYPKMQPDGKRYFFLQILQDCADEYNTDIRIVLKYYSALTNCIYRSSEIKYEDQGIWGTYTDTYHPQWQ